MPVTTRASPVTVKPTPVPRTYNELNLLAAAAPTIHHPWEGKHIINSSFSNTNHVRPSHNGFINTILDAYVQHNHLVLRPEDVWFAILVQFSFYVNKHSEELREYFVDHAGKKKLKINQDELDLKAVVLQMTHLIAANVKDASLREWIMPSFTTTTVQDKISASIIMMGTMQKYFVYMCEETCGIPSVTLLGEKSDWEDILERVQFLGTFGTQHEELLIWNSVLTTLMTKFLRTFDAPDSPEVVKFWQSSVHDYVQGYTGFHIVTGWIQAFCFWDAEGSPLVVKNVRELTMNWRLAVKEEGMDYWLDSVRLGELRWDEVPTGFVHVPIHVNSFGDKYIAKAVAGSFGWKVLDSETVFSVTRRKEKPPEEPTNSSENRSRKMSKKKKPHEPSMFSDSTLVESAHMRQPSLLRTIVQKLSCFHTELSQPPKVPVKAWEPPSSKPQSVDDAPASPPRNPFWRPGAAERLREQLPKLLSSEPISDLSELQEAWQYEEGGKHDTLQPVTGWWIIRTSDGEYGRDPDCPDVQFDSDAEDYDDEWARGGQRSLR
jgi:hypothetical protein